MATPPATRPQRNEPALVGEAWSLDPLEPAGAVELYRRVEAAAPHSVPRTELDGRTDLTVLELYEMGCTLRPLGLRGAGGWLAWRLAAVLGTGLCAFGAAGVVAAIASGFGLSDDPDPLGLDAGVSVAIFFTATVSAGLWLIARAVRELRAIDRGRRQAGGSAARSPSDDPHARAAATVLRGPGCLRVQLLWLRADPLDASRAESRLLAERRVQEDDEGRAEDALVAFSEIALRAREAHALRMSSGFAALGVRRKRERPAAAARHGASAAPISATSGPRARGDDARRPVPPGWSPDPMSDDGAAELARRLCLAPVQRWTAEALAPLVVDRPLPAREDPPTWPTGGARLQRRAVPRRPWRWTLGVALATAAVALASDDAGGRPTTGARILGYAALALAVALLAVRAAWVRRGPGAALRRAVRAAAARSPRGLEQGLPGMAGVVAVLDGREGDARRIALVHVRAAPDDGKRGELEMRILAWRPLTAAEAAEPVEPVRDLWLVADGAQARARSAQASMRLLARLATRLGQATAAPRSSRLVREPLVWLAALAPMMLVAASIKHTIAGDWALHGVVNRTLSYAWVLGAGVLLWFAARRTAEPFSRS